MGFINVCSKVSRSNVLTLLERCCFNVETTSCDVVSMSIERSDVVGKMLF